MVSNGNKTLKRIIIDVSGGNKPKFKEQIRSDSCYLCSVHQALSSTSEYYLFVWAVGAGGRSAEDLNAMHFQAFIAGIINSREI